MPIADPYQAKLREALVGAVQTKVARDRRRAVVRRAALATAALIAVVATVVTIALPNDRAEASIDIQVRDGTVFLRLLDLENRPEEIVGALRNAGIDAVVESVPVGPSNVGRFVGSASTQSTGMRTVRDSRFSFTSFEIPLDFDGVLTLSLGRAAAQGEVWTAASDATAKGEVLGCRAVRGLTAAEAARAVADMPVTVRWEGPPGVQLPPGAALSPPYASWRVVDLVAPTVDRVVITLTEDGHWPFAPPAPPPVDPSCKGK